MITDNMGQQYIYFAITLYVNIVKTVPTPVSSKTEYTVQGREKGMDSEVLNKD
jgi:hypothetical protein